MVNFRGDGGNYTSWEKNAYIGRWSGPILQTDLRFFPLAVVGCVRALLTNHLSFAPSTLRLDHPL